LILYSLFIHIKPGLAVPLQFVCLVAISPDPRAGWSPAVDGVVEVASPVADRDSDLTSQRVREHVRMVFGKPVEDVLSGHRGVELGCSLFDEIPDRSLVVDRFHPTSLTERVRRRLGLRG